MKKAIAMILTLALALSLAACGQSAASSAAASSTPAANASSMAAGNGKTYTIGLSMSSTADEIYTRIMNDSKSICEAGGHTLLVSDANSDATAQVTAIENFITSGYDAIIVQAVDANALNDVLEKAHNAGIKIVALFIELSVYDAWYKNDEYGLGYLIGTMCGEWVNENYGGKGKVGML